MGRRVGDGRALRGARPVGPGSEPGTHSGEDTRAVKPHCSPFAISSRPVEPFRARRASGRHVDTMSRPCALAALLVAPRRLLRRPAPSASPSGVRRRLRAPSTSPSATPGAFGAIEHATGATDVVLRFDEGGGFVMPAFLASQAPIFTLYGDGTVIFRNPVKDEPPSRSATSSGPARSGPRKLTEEQIQDLLEWRSARAGSAIARADYPNDHGRGRVDRDLHGQRRRPQEDRLGLRARDRGPEHGRRDPARTAFLASSPSGCADFDQGGTHHDRRRTCPSATAAILHGGLGRAIRTRSVAVDRPHAGRLRLPRRPERASSCPAADPDAPRRSTALGDRRQSRAASRG